VIILSNKAKVLIITGKLDNKIGVIGDTNYLRKLGLGTYSEALKLYLLDLAEIAYIMYKGLAKFKDSKGEISLRDLFTKYSSSKVDWIKFTVLLDLRNRGRKAKAGFSPNSLIYEKGSSKVMVFVAEENSPLEAKQLIEWIDVAIKKGYEPVLAVVDAHGDVTYYSMLLLRPEDLKVKESEGRA